MTADLHWKGVALDPATALALLDWQRELGVDEAILDAPVDRYAEPLRPPAPLSAAPENTPAHASPTARSGIPTGRAGHAPSSTRAVTEARHSATGNDDDLPARARTAAAAATSLADLAAAMERFDGLDIRRGARNFVFADGNPAARVMILGEAPGEEEDRLGRPFVGRAGQLLDQMLAAIGLARDAPDAERAVYITNVLNWRPPGNRRPEPHEIDAMLPFVARHVELAAPEVIVLMGNSACQAALGRQGIQRLRGNWVTAFDRPALPMTHPAYLLRTPLAKREAWADLLALNARLQEPAQP